MTGYILDASALIALARAETGAEIVERAIPDAAISAVNASEAFMRGAEKGIPVEAMQDLLASFGVEIVPFDQDMAVLAALLRQQAKRLGLSFCDRACLATAIHRRSTALTADRMWAELDLPCTIELIR